MVQSITRENPFVFSAAAADDDDDAEIEIEKMDTAATLPQGKANWGASRYDVRIGGGRWVMEKKT